VTVAINHFDVVRRVGNNVEALGHLFIDSPLHRQDQLLAELTDQDRSEIGWHLGITNDSREKLSTNIEFHLRAFAANRMDVPEKPDFKTEAGRDAWVKP
jgi:hypothetical protein